MWETLLDGCWDPRDFWMSASISAKRLATAYSMDSLIEERFDAAIEWDGASVVGEG